MKIVQINAVHTIRSTGRQVVELCDFYRSKNHECTIAFSIGEKIENTYKIGNSIDRRIHAFLSRLFGNQGYYSKRSTKKFINFLKTYKPDIVHLNNLHANYINLKLLLNYLACHDIPTVITLHDCWFYTGKCTHYTLKSCYRWKKSCGNCPQLKTDNVSWIFDRTSKTLNDKKKLINNIPRLAVVGVSRWITSEARQSILKDATFITNVYNWIDLNVFRSVKSNNSQKYPNLENKYILIGVASSWGVSKGLDVFLKLSDELSEDEVILLVGNLPKSTKLNDRILNIKEIDDVQELVKLYSMSDVFVNLSTEESFGKVTVEALACGLPVITNNHTANPEIINERCGIILNDIKVDKILEALKIIRANTKEYYSSYCRDWVEKQFKYQDKAQDYLNLYKRLVGSGD